MNAYILPNEIQQQNFKSFDMDHLHEALDLSDAKSKFIHVGGASAAGKTTLSLLLKLELPRAQNFSFDSYLVAGLGAMAGKLSDTPPNPNKPYIGGITPEVWEMSLVEEHIKSLRQGKEIDMPVFDETIKDRTGYVTFIPSEYVIFEGGHSFSHQFRGLADYKVLVIAPFHDRLTRKLVRTHARYRRDDIDDIIERYTSKDEPSWSHYQDEFKEIADQVFNNPADPSKDYIRVPNARYEREDGPVHLLTPKRGYGSIRIGEYFGFVELNAKDCQLFYQVDGNEIVNLRLGKEYIKMLETYYEVGSTPESNTSAGR